MAAGSGHHQPPVDAALILAIRNEINEAVRPVCDKLDGMTERLAAGDTRFALQEARLAALENRCQQHQALIRGKGKSSAEADTEKMGKKELNPVLLAVITAAVAGPVGALAVFLLKGAAETAK